MPPPPGHGRDRRQPDHPGAGQPPVLLRQRAVELQCDTPNEGREAIDRKLITVEPAQITLAQQVFAANPNTVVVLVSSYPQALGWIGDNIPAIVHIANSGQELGTAVADVLFGDYNPAGRTTMTWYANETDLPSDVFQYDIRAGKGLTYQYFTGTPLYPFGFGLSFTTFAYSNLQVGATSLAPCDETTVSVDVQNTGTREGDEVVQLYVGYPDTAIVRPTKQLRGFKRIHLGGRRDPDGQLPAARRGARLLGRGQQPVRAGGGHGVDPGRRVVGGHPGDGLADDTPLTRPAPIPPRNPLSCCRRSFGPPARLRLPSTPKEAACPSLDPSSSVSRWWRCWRWRPGRPGRRARSAASSSRAATRS